MARNCRHFAFMVDLEECLLGWSLFPGPELGSFSNQSVRVQGAWLKGAWLPFCHLSRVTRGRGRGWKMPLLVLLKRDLPATVGLWSICCSFSGRLGFKAELRQALLLVVLPSCVGRTAEWKRNMKWKPATSLEDVSIIWACQDRVIFQKWLQSFLFSFGHSYRAVAIERGQCCQTEFIMNKTRGYILHEAWTLKCVSFFPIKSSCIDRSTGGGS